MRMRTARIAYVVATMNVNSARNRNGNRPATENRAVRAHTWSQTRTRSTMNRSAATSTSSLLSLLCFLVHVRRLSVFTPTQETNSALASKIRVCSFCPFDFWTSGSTCNNLIYHPFISCIVFSDRVYQPTAYIHTDRILQLLFYGCANRHILITIFTQTKVVTSQNSQKLYKMQ